nr:baseplate J/gp47 family protein [Aneurinibacillus sp. XH2]
MYEHMTYEYILKRMLDRVPNNVDKREGSVIYDACAPAAAELAQMYIEMDINYNLSFADTATGEELSRKTAEFGVNREPATKAKRLGLFYGSNSQLMDIPLGSRFSIGNLTYVAISKISTGNYTVECETAGAIGNQRYGTMLPIDVIDGLVRAELSDVLVPGEDEETDEHLRQRYYEAVNEPAFGGNISDYKQKIGSIAGVGGVKVFPVWQGGGTVKCTIIGSDLNEPSSTLVDEVQTIVDPTVNQGKGLGTAPIGHKVTITGVQGVTINVETTVTLESGMTVGQVEGPIREVIEAYLLGLRKDWANQDQLVVRVSLIDAAILTVSGVLDVADTKLNGAVNNVQLGEEDIPILGTVTINV